MLAVIFVVQVYYGFAHGYQEAVIRMDDDSNYFNYQNIIKAVNMSKPPWVYGHNFGKDDNSETGKELLQLATSCVYFKKESLNETHVNFTKHYKKDKDMETEHLFGTFFTTPGIGTNGAPTSRSAPNAITVSSSPEGPNSSFKLIYSDDKDCAILRPFPLEQFKGASLDVKPDAKVGEVPGLSYYDPTSSPSYKSVKQLCIVLLSEDKARNGGLPKVCNTTYQNMCGKGPEFKVVFNQSCPRIPNPLGC